MKTKLLFLVLLLSSFVIQAQYVERNLIGNAIDETELRAIYKRLPEWRKQKKTEVLSLYASIPQNHKQEIIRRAEGYLDFGFPSLPASKYILYTETGNRTEYQDAVNELQNVVSALAMAEIMEGKGRFTRKLMDGIWAVSEATTWCHHAHQTAAAKKAGLPTPGEHVVDIFAGNVAALMCWNLLLLEDQLEALSPAIPQRIRYELDKRIIQPNLVVDFHRMGLNKTPANNWNPWINKNWLITLAMGGFVDENTFVKSMQRLIPSIDNYTNWYPADGGCDEGAGYWGASPSHYYTILQFLGELSPQKITSIKNDPLIHNMITYIYKMEIDQKIFVNFADCSAHVSPSPALIYLWGDYLGDNDLKGYAAYRAQVSNFDNALGAGTSIINYYNNAMAWKGLQGITPKGQLPIYSPFPDLQVVTTRDKAGMPDGFFMAAKGGNNNESHNHNDIGNFIVSFDGVPLLIDVGVGVYTKFTFSPQRYDIWTMQSQWHNTPTINGFQQQNGSQYVAENVTMNNDARKTVFALDIAKSYPAEAGINTWKREITLNRGKNVMITDKYSLQRADKPHEQNLMTVFKPEITGNGKITVSGNYLDKSASAEIQYDAKNFDVFVDEHSVDDDRLTPVWGDKVYRIRLVAKKAATAGTDKIVIAKK